MSLDLKPVYERNILISNSLVTILEFPILAMVHINFN